jgi:hypothetical protein
LSVLLLVGAARTDETAAVRAIVNLGGRITRDAKLPGRPVIGIDLTDPRPFRIAVRVTDAALKYLTEFKGLQTLNLSGTVGLPDALRGWWAREESDKA